MGCQKIKAVIFDLDDTLFDCTGQLTDPARKRAVDILEKKIPGLTRERLFAKQVTLSNEHGSSGAIELIGRQNGLSRADIHKALEAYNRLEVENIHPFPETLPTLETLRKLGIKQVVATSGRPERQGQKVQSLGLDSFFTLESGTLFFHDDLADSYKDATLETALVHLSVPADFVLSVGDKLDSEIAASNRLGMITVRLLHGRQKDRQPANPDETPDHEIASLNELLQLIETS
jgi:putative hydrolase of the HAD superfamily